MEVEFHTGLAEPLEHAGKLLRKAVRQGERVWLATPEVDALSRRLWLEPERGFFAHARPGAAPATWPRSPVWLLPDFVAPPGATAAPPVWINLGPSPAPADAGCGRLIELVGADPDAVRAGRERWREYLARGWQPRKVFDAASPP